MTCVVGVEHDGRVWLGADSAGVSGWSLTVRADEKVFRTGPFVMGFTSSFRMGQLLRYSFNPPKQAKSQDDYEFMCTAFVDEVRRCLKDGGYMTTTNGNEAGGTFLVGYKGSLYAVHDDFQVARAACGFDAVGCGGELALGALHATAKTKPRPRLTAALRAAEAFSAGVSGPFEFVSGGVSIRQETQQ